LLAIIYNQSEMLIKEKICLGRGPNIFFPSLSSFSL